MVTKYGLNFVPGLSLTNTALTTGGAFANAYAKALEKGASQVEAVKQGLKAGIIAAGLDQLAGKLTGRATDQTFKNARDALNTLKQRGPVPKMVVKGTVNAVGYVGTVAGVEKESNSPDPWSRSLSISSQAHSRRPSRIRDHLLRAAICRAIRALFLWRGEQAD